jgi:hypothetical protein
MALAGPTLPSCLGFVVSVCPCAVSLAAAVPMSTLLSGCGDLQLYLVGHCVSYLV